MSTALRGKTQDSGKPSGAGLRFAIAAAEWNPAVTDALLEGALHSFREAGVAEKDVRVVRVPGSFELTAAASWLLDSHAFDAVVVLGCVVQGETRHFDFICQGVTQGITELNRTTGTPVIFGVLTTLSQEQALERAGGRHGNKGSEAAEAAIQMAILRKSI